MMFAALALGASAIALPRYQPSDAFIFSDGRVERVVRVEGDQITWGGLSGPTYRRSRNFVVPVLEWRSGRGIGQRSYAGDPDSLWRTTRASSARFRVIARTRARPQEGWKRAVTLWTCRRMRPRSVRLSFGDFDTIPFACDRYSATSMRLIERLEWDYAPELGHYVRRSAVDYFRGTRRTIRLVATLTGPAANRRRLAALSRSARRGEVLWNE
jgi:hypothetical protein